jgi:hypothetical protein
MKFPTNKNFILSLLAIILITGIVSKKLKDKSLKSKNSQVNLVRDMNGFNSDISHVIRRDPSVVTVTKLGNYRLQPVSHTLNMSNSNTSTLPNVGFLGRNAEIVGKYIKFICRTSCCIT